MTEEERLVAVQQNGYAIQYIKNPSEAVQLAAVRENSWVIRCIKNPSEAIQLAAVQRNNWAIAHIENPSKFLLFYVFSNEKNPDLKEYCLNKMLPLGK